MAHSLGLQVVAEGVETEDHIACLGNLDCDRLQGFLLSRPALPDDIPILLTKTHPACGFVASGNRPFTAVEVVEDNRAIPALNASA